MLIKIVENCVENLSFVKGRNLVMFLASIKRISQKCTKPEEVLEAMKRTMRQTIKLIHARYVVDLLQDLTKRGIGTNSVENRCKDICIDLPF